MIRVALLLLCALGAALPAQNTEGPLPVGCVDVASLLKDHPHFVNAREAAARTRKERLDDLRTRRDELATRSEEIDLYPEGTEEYFAVAEKIALARATLEIERDTIVATYNLDIVDGLKAAYRDIEKKVADLAKERGMTIVAQVHSRELTGRSQREVLTEIFTRPFVHWDPRLDLTEAVRERL